MMQLRLHLISDAGFTAGEGVAGLLDSELQHDMHGLPYLRGRSLKGLLAEECANVLYALYIQGHPAERTFTESARRLFGEPGAGLNGQGGLNVGDAQLSDDLRCAIQDGDVCDMTPDQVLESLTAIRRQTAMSEQGAPLTGSLRSMRVLLRETVLTAGLSFMEPPDADQCALLAACVMSLRRAGSHRNRGLGRLRTRLLAGDADITEAHWLHFKHRVMEERV